MDKNTALNYLMYKVEEDEPVFILRGNDVLAVPTIFKWADLAKDYHVRQSKVESAITAAGEFLRYDGIKKIPD